MKLELQSAMKSDGTMCDNVLGFEFKGFFIYNTSLCETGFEYYTDEESCEYYGISIEEINLIRNHNKDLDLM